MEEICYLNSHIKSVFLSDPMLLELAAPITVCGDIHGQFHDLLQIFDTVGPPPDTQLLFLGDYVDRGMQSVDTICLLFAYKIKYPKRIFLLRGNHEDAAVCSSYGFRDECYRAYGNGLAWQAFCETFQYMPIAAVIEQAIFCVHGGLSPELHSLDDIRTIERPVQIPDSGLLCDLVWSDPRERVDTWTPNRRGASVYFGRPQVDQFLDTCQLDVICRAHETVGTGYEFPLYPDATVITLFSAPNYTYTEGNLGAVMNVDETAYCRFLPMEPAATGRQRAMKYPP
jgi:serine/threonine-protein phosphatase PP1 catalytic subunit